MSSLRPELVRDPVEVDRLLGVMSVKNAMVGRFVPTELRQHGRATSELRAKERTLDELRWRLASAARRTAADDPDAAA
jgi:hypothetical protein